MQSELSEIRKSIRNAVGAIESNQVFDKDVHGTLTRVLSRLDALTAALSDQERAVEVKIKPLEWRQQEPDVFVAETSLVGVYSIWPQKSVEWRCSLTEGIFPSSDAAKAAAQADYEQRIRSALVDVPVEPVNRKFKLGDHVCKTKGSSWVGHVVGFYSTELTPVGYAVESSRERGSVQIYPEAALKLIGPASPLREGEDSAEAFARIVSARKAYVDAAETYNTRLSLVNSERAKGNWSMRVDDEARAMWDAQSAFIKAAEEETDAALAATRSASATSPKGVSE